MLRRSMIAALVLTLLMGVASFGGTVSASAAAKKIWLYVDNNIAYVNGVQTTLTSPATVYDGKMYVPVKFLGDTFGFPVQWDEATNTISMTAGQTDVLIDLTARTSLVNGMPGSLQPTFEISKDGKLMAQLTWMMDRIGATYEYDPKLSRVEVVYNPFSAELPSSESSKPIAKFTFGKPSYKIGEKVQYIDLSYDVEGDGIAFVYWKGREDAFFTSGEKTVQLQVEDSEGNKSDWVSKTVTITNETMYTPIEFQMHHAKLQSFVKLTGPQLSPLRSAAKFAMDKKEIQGRRLLMSDSPETIVEYGQLYRDTVRGKARLYANHVNDMSDDVQFAIIATNNGDKPVTIETTRQGEVYPSVFVHLIGYQAAVDFLVGDTNKPALTVGPGESKAYAYLPKLSRGQGINLIYDVTTSGSVTFTFAAMKPGDPMETALSYQELPFSGHIRGTFPVSDIQMTADASGLREPMRFTVGDNEDDKYVRGFDPFRGQFVEDTGNYGVNYSIRVKHPGKAAIVLLARGGSYKGAMKINGEMVLAPASGVLTALDGVFMLHRTDSADEYVDIEFMPAAGSFLPLDFIFYPLD